MIKKSRDIRFLSRDQYSTPKNLRDRWELYNYCSPYLDIYAEAIKRLHLQGDENILEVGCGEGKTLVQLRLERGHVGELTGVDLNAGIFAEANAQQFQQGLNINFIEISADRFPFKDGSFDILLSFFMLYHMPDIDKALIEWTRVLKSGSKMLIATGSKENRIRHTLFRKRLAEILGMHKSDKFSDTFNLENGQDQLSKHFKKIETFVFETQIIVKEPELYLRSLSSTRKIHFGDVNESRWKSALRQIEIEIENEIRNIGYFSDLVKRGFFLVTLP